MRVTERSQVASLLQRIQTNQTRLQDALTEASSGTRIQRPSDDPLAAQAIQGLEASLARHQSFLSVQDSLRGELHATEAALQSGSAVLGDALELAMQMSSGAHTSQSFAAAADAVGLLREGLREAANARHQDRFLFGGVADHQPPFDPAGAFQGSATVREIPIGDQQTLTQISGEEVFSPQGENLFALLDELQAALTNADQSAAGDTIDRIRQGISSLNASQQEVGHRLNTLDHARAFSEVVVLDGTREIDRLEAADLAEAASRIQLASTALQASAQAAQRVNGLKDLLFKL